MSYDFQNGAGVGVGVIALKRLLSLAREAPAPPPKTLYLNSFLATEQLEGPAAALREAGDLEIKCWRPPLSLLGKRLGLKTELY